MNQDRWANIRVFCTYGVKILFLYCVAFIAIVNILNRSVANVVRFSVIIVLILLLLFGAKYVTERFLHFFDKNFKIVLGIYLLLLFGLQIAFGSMMRYMPLWDLGSVYHGAVSWVENVLFTGSNAYLSNWYCI